MRGIDKRVAIEQIFYYRTALLFGTVLLFNEEIKKDQSRSGLRAKLQ
jgi:hypothetical protein